MEEEKNKKQQVINFAIGIVVGIVLYKLVFDVLWPMLF